MEGDHSILLDLSEWTRLKEVEEYAERRSIDLGKAIRELVEQALSEPEPGGYVSDWLAVGDSFEGLTADKRPLFDAVISVSESPAGGLYDVRVIDRHSKRGAILGESTDLPTLDDALTAMAQVATEFLPLLGEEPT